MVPCFLDSCLLAGAADRPDIFCNLQHQDKESRLKPSKSLPLGPGTMAAMSEDSCVNFKEMMFIDNTLYFIRKSKSVGQMQGSDTGIQQEKKSYSELRPLFVIKFYCNVYSPL